MQLLSVFKPMHRNVSQTTQQIILIFIACITSLAILKGIQRKVPTFSSSHIRNGVIKSRIAWNNDNGRANEFCRKIFDDPRPYFRRCKKRDPVGHNCTIGGENVYLMFSQYEQDYYLYVNHFSKLKRRGRYLDIATNDPVTISNTFFFDRCLEWDGICVEANPKYFEPIYTKRSCQLVPTCVSTEDGTKVTFAFRGGLGGIKDDTYKFGSRFENHTRQEANMTCTSVGNVLDRYEMQMIDYLSLDIEGHELAVLQGINWNTTIINVMTIEVNKNTTDDIAEFLESKGYKRHNPKNYKRNKLGPDLVYLHQDVVFGKPV